MHYQGEPGGGEEERLRLDEVANCFFNARVRMRGRIPLMHGWGCVCMVKGRECMGVDKCAQQCRLHC